MATIILSDNGRATDLVSRAAQKGQTRTDRPTWHTPIANNTSILLCKQTLHSFKSHNENSGRPILCVLCSPSLKEEE